MRPKKKLLKQLLNFFLDLVFPKTCIKCHQPGGFYLCKKCHKHLDIASPQVYTPRSKKLEFYIDSIIAPFHYQNETIQKLLLSYKYGYAHDIRQTITDLILTYLKPVTIKMIQNNIDGITCVPLHKNKEKKRGFNQSHLIAKELAKEFRIPYSPNLLSRKINTKAQASMDRKNRLKNMKNVFEINPNFNLKGLNILIVDDVATTLATMNEAAYILKKNGVGKVWGLTVARG